MVYLKAVLILILSRYGPVRSTGSRKQFDSRPKKQFLIADGRTIYGFSKRVKGQGFPTCASFVDKTCDIKCQVGRESENNN